MHSWHMAFHHNTLMSHGGAPCARRNAWCTTSFVPCNWGRTWRPTTHNAWEWRSAMLCYCCGGPPWQCFVHNGAPCTLATSWRSTTFSYLLWWGDIQRRWDMVPHHASCNIVVGRRHVAPRHIAPHHAQSYCVVEHQELRCHIVAHHVVAQDVVGRYAPPPLHGAPPCSFWWRGGAPCLSTLSWHPTTPNRYYMVQCHANLESCGALPRNINLVWRATMCLEFAWRFAMVVMG